MSVVNERWPTERAGAIAGRIDDGMAWQCSRGRVWSGPDRVAGVEGHT